MNIKTSNNLIFKVWCNKNTYQGNNRLIQILHSSPRHHRLHFADEVELRIMQTAKKGQINDCSSKTKPKNLQPATDEICKQLYKKTNPKVDLAALLFTLWPSQCLELITYSCANGSRCCFSDSQLSMNLQQDEDIVERQSNSGKDGRCWWTNHLGWSSCAIKIEKCVCVF